MTTSSHELALSIINNGALYQHSMRAARAGVRNRAFRWLLIVQRGAASYMKGDPKLWTEVFTPEDVLLCALELEEYYANYLKEVEEVKKTNS